MNAKTVLFLVGVAATLSAHAQTKEEVINEAVQHGAVIVVCESSVCRNVATGEKLGYGADGTYLVYPNDPLSKEHEKKTAEKLAALGRT